MDQVIHPNLSISSRLSIHFRAIDDSHHTTPILITRLFLHPCTIHVPDADHSHTTPRTLHPISHPCTTHVANVSHSHHTIPILILITPFPFSIPFPILVPSMGPRLAIVMPTLEFPREPHIFHQTQRMEYSRFLCQIKVNTLTTHNFNLGAVIRFFYRLSHPVTKLSTITRNSHFRCFSC